MPAFGIIPKTTFTMSFEFGDVVLVPFPFTDQSGSKKRPAVVVSDKAVNAALPDVIVMAITSQLRPNRRAREVWLQGWQSAGLLKPSAVKPVISTVERTLVLKKIGALKDEDRDSLRGLIGTLLGK